MQPVCAAARCRGRPTPDRCSPSRSDCRARTGAEASPHFPAAACCGCSRCNAWDALQTLRRALQHYIGAESIRSYLRWCNRYRCPSRRNSSCCGHGAVVRSEARVQFRNTLGKYDQKSPELTKLRAAQACCDGGGRSMIRALSVRARQRSRC